MDTVMICSGLAFSAAVLSKILKRISPDFSFGVSVAAVTALFGAALGFISVVRNFCIELALGMGLPEGSIELVFKTAAIGVITKLTAEICRASDESAVASAVEFTGACAGVVSSIPLWQGIIEMLYSFL